jgi:hypothetical protein
VWERECFICSQVATIYFISFPLIPYSYGVEVFRFSLDLHTIGRTPWTSDRPVARPLPKYRSTQTQNKHTHQISMPEVGLEPTIIASDRAETVHVLDRLDTVTGVGL